MFHALMAVKFHSFSTRYFADSPTADGDLLSPVAIENANVTCHNVQDLLHLRGFTSKPGQFKTKRSKVASKKGKIKSKN